MVVAMTFLNWIQPDPTLTAKQRPIRHVITPRRRLDGPPFCRRVFGAALLILMAAGAASAEELTGPLTILSGGIVRIDGHEVRLMGVDAPNLEQRCWDAKGQAWACGQDAATALKAKAGEAPAKCRGTRRDQNDRLIAICEVGAINLNAWLVAEGWALAYRSQSLAFVADEDKAREGAKGLWAGAFEPPTVWRRKHLGQPPL